MSNRTRSACLLAGGGLAFLAAGVAGAAVTGSQADDLAVVRRAVRQTPAPGSRGGSGGAPGTREARPVHSAAPEDVTPPEPPRLKGARELRWFKVRIVENAPKRTKVTVNLPIGVVRALEEWPVDLHCGRGSRVRVRGRDADCSIRLGDILAGLEAGQDIVTVESDDATVRVWVE